MPVDEESDYSPAAWMVDAPVMSELDEDDDEFDRAQPDVELLSSSRPCCPSKPATWSFETRSEVRPILSAQSHSSTRCDWANYYSAHSSPASATVVLSWTVAGEMSAMIYGYFALIAGETSEATSATSSRLLWHVAHSELSSVTLRLMKSDLEFPARWCHCREMTAMARELGSLPP